MKAKFTVLLLALLATSALAGELLKEISPERAKVEGEKGRPRTVRILSEFRDRYLVTNTAGRFLIETYCTVSPPIAGFISRHPALKKITRIGLKPAIWYSRKVVQD